MPTDPNARRDKALTDIAGYLKSIDRSLKVIARNSQPTSLVTNTYLDSAQTPADELENVEE